MADFDNIFTGNVKSKLFYLNSILHWTHSPTTTTTQTARERWETKSNFPCPVPWWDKSDYPDAKKEETERETEHAS